MGNRRKRKEKSHHEHGAQARQREREAKSEARREAKERAQFLSSHPRRESERQTTICPVCGENLHEGSCVRCGTLLLAVPDDASRSGSDAGQDRVRVRVRGRLLRRPATETEFVLELADAVILHVEVNDQTRWIGSELEDGKVLLLPVGVEVQAVGVPVDHFADPEGGLRDAAVLTHGLRYVELVAMGDSAGDDLDSVLTPEPAHVPSVSVSVPTDPRPYPVEVYWEDLRSGRRLLHLFHRSRDVMGALRGIWVLVFAPIAIGLLTLVTGSSGRALELFNAGAPWAIGLLPPLLYVVAVIPTGGRHIRVDGEDLWMSYSPLPWRPGWRVAVGAVTRLFREEESLKVELRSGGARTLIQKGTEEQLDYIEAVVDKMLKDGPGPWIEDDLRAGEYGGSWLPFLILGLVFLPLVFVVLLYSFADPW